MVYLLLIYDARDWAIQRGIHCYEIFFRRVAASSNNRLHKGAQKRGGLGNSDFFIKRASNTVRIAFVPCEAERYVPGGSHGKS